MIDKRPARFAAGARRYIFLSVFARWLGLLCGAAFAFGAARFASDLFAAIFERTDETLTFPAVLPFLGLCCGAAFLRALCAFFASKAAFGASAVVRKNLRAALCEKFAALDENDGATAARADEGESKRIEAYFGGHLPEIFYGAAASVTLFALFAPLYLPIACVPLACAALLLPFVPFAARTARGRTRERPCGIPPAAFAAHIGTAFGVVLAAHGLLSDGLGLFGALAALLLASEFFAPLRRLASSFGGAKRTDAANETKGMRPEADPEGRLAALMRPAAGFTVLAVLLGAAGRGCAIALPVIGCYALLSAFVPAGTFPVGFAGFAAAIFACAVLRGAFRCGERLCHRRAASRLRDGAAAALRRLFPEELERLGTEADPIAAREDDMGIVEAFRARTVSPIAVAVLVSAAVSVYVGSFHTTLGLAAACSFPLVGAALPYFVSLFGSDAAEMRRRSAERKESAVLTLSTFASALCSLWIFALSYSIFAGEAAVGFDGVIVPFLTLLSSFGPAFALSKLGPAPASANAAARRVFAPVDEEGS
ncbi:MAG: hypothetical protein LBD95_05230 [Clostridiales Family XIII bacterium]|jgi:ABC-type multidrug transport system fused ATPase/permease subunit|nr:hypothetical protein [Clostridiales Family XIII bacterium]